MNYHPIETILFNFPFLLQGSYQSFASKWRARSPNIHIYKEMGTWTSGIKIVTSVKPTGRVSLVFGASACYPQHMRPNLSSLNSVPSNTTHGQVGTTIGIASK